jgi:lysophospholipid acyltransferase (LPLAT)-like uncharacterized protein
MLHKLLQYLIWYFIRALFLTIRVEFKNREMFEKGRALHPNRVFIFALWHENVVSVLRAHAWGEPWLTLASRSKDGDYAAFVAKKLGFIPVRGSSRKKNVDKGGKEALLQYIKGFREGLSGGITVDGPRGPRRQCKPGVVSIAQQTGAPIIPVTAFASSYWQFNSWDRFKIPKPFSKVTVIYGEALLVSETMSESDLASSCREVTDRLNAIDHHPLG